MSPPCEIKIVLQKGYKHVFSANLKIVLSGPDFPAQTAKSYGRNSRRLCFSTAGKNIRNGE